MLRSPSQGEEMVGRETGRPRLQASVMSEEAILEMDPPASVDTIYIRDKLPS